jgi:hypothetical protein
MWIFMNDGFFSIVEDKKNPHRFSIRARKKGDLERVFLVKPAAVLETTESDYRFRIFLPKDIVAKRMAEEIESINYTNFKDSIPKEDKDRYSIYAKVWHVMFDWQDRLYPPKAKDQWWKNYKYRKQEKYDKYSAYADYYNADED